MWDNIPLRKKIQKHQSEGPSHTFCPWEHQSIRSHYRELIHCGTLNLPIYLYYIEIIILRYFTKRKILALSLSIHLRRMLLKKHLQANPEVILGHKPLGENVMHPVEEEQGQEMCSALQLTHLSVLMTVSVIRISNLQRMRLAMPLHVSQDGM